MMEERLGRALFDSFPRAPGIYRFYDKAGTLLYVGKASNLHNRLASYRRARAGKVPRKVGELVSRIHRIETDVHTSSDEALLAENRWIRWRRPPYNHANKHTETYYYIIIGRDDATLNIRLSMSLLPEEDGVLRFGCFKGHIRVRRMLGTLLQLFWLAINRPPSPHFLPVQLTRRITPLHYRLRFRPAYAGAVDHDYAIDPDPGIDPGPETGTVPDLLPQSHPHPDEALNLMQTWFEGRSDSLLERLASWNMDFSTTSSFNRLYLEDALTHLNECFSGILQPHRQMRETWLHGRPTIGRDELDDLLVALATAERQKERL
jgi:hypothetical protein